MRHCLVIALIALLASACQHAPSQRETGFQPLVLISIDGLRPSDIDLADTPNLDALAARGVRAESMEPVFPSSTFPNHYSLVTGLYPAQHGIVANTMRDPRLDAEFSLGNNEQVRNGFWWQGEPIWVTAEQQGQRAATLFWPGSEAEIQSTRPSYYRPYEHNMPHQERVEQVLNWLDLPIADRPTFLTLYFSTVDSAGHDHGPGSPAVINALEEIDAQLGALMQGMQQRGLLEQSHLLLVSDHGMAELSPERRIFVDDYLPLQRLNGSLFGAVAFFWPEAQAIDEIERTLKDAHPAMTVARPDALPEAFRFVDHRRIPPLLAYAKPGWVITHRGPDAPYSDGTGGAHGYDPRSEAMQAVFIAAGPRLRPGSALGRIKNRDVYPLMAHLLGLNPAPNEGRLERFEPVLLN